MKMPLTNEQKPIYLCEQIDRNRFPVMSQFHQIWEAARDGRFAPSWKELEFSSFPAKIIPYMYLIDVQQEPARFKYRFIGTKVCELEGQDYTNRFVHDLQPRALASAAVCEFRKFAKNPKPVFFMMVANKAGHRRYLYDVYGGVRLPLSNDGKTLNQIIALAQFGHENEELIKHFYETDSSRLMS